MAKETRTIVGTKFYETKYGENANQSPAYFYVEKNDDPLSLDKFMLVAGTPLSYNNMCDLDRSLQTLTRISASWCLNFSEDAGADIALVVKHGNACGAGIAYNRVTAIKKMTAGDPQAMFGGTVMLNFPVGSGEAKLLLYDEQGNKRLFDVIIAPAFSEEAIALLSRKKDKCRFVTNPHLLDLNQDSLDQSPIFRHVRGGFLEQPNYTFVLDLNDPDLKKYGPEDRQYEKDIIMAKAICDTSNSNTITVVRSGKLLANAAGRTSRVGCARLAINLADDSGHSLEGAVVASDSFFPFTDGPEILAKAGIKAIVSCSGSIADPQVIAYCEKEGVVLYLTPVAKGRGFYKH